MLNPGTSLAEANRIGAVAEGLIREVPEVAQVGRRTGRAELDEHAEGVHSAEIDVDLKRSRPRPRGGHGRDPREARRAAGAGGDRPADFAPARPPAVRRARADRAEDLRRRHRHAARPRRTDAGATGERAGAGRPHRRKAGADPADHRAPRPPQGGAGRARAGRGDPIAAGPDRRRARRADRRRRTPLRAGAAPARRTAQPAGPGTHADRHAGRSLAGVGHRRGRGD